MDDALAFGGVSIEWIGFERVDEWAILEVAVNRQPSVAKS